MPPNPLLHAMHQQVSEWSAIKAAGRGLEATGCPFHPWVMLANWIIYCAENYLLLKFYDYFHRQLLKRKYLMADETRVQVLNEPERNPETDSWMWLFRSGEDGLPPILLYHYTETRAKFHAASFLQGFGGYRRLMDIKVITICRISNDALAGHM